MSVISALLDDKIYSFEQAFGVRDLTTPVMRQAIEEWYQLYYNAEPSREQNPCQRLPVTIVNKLTKAVFGEYSAAVGRTGAKGEYLGTVLTALDRCRKKALQQALIGGQCFLKPVFTPWGVSFRLVERRNFLVLGRGVGDEITDISTDERTVAGKQYYTLLERRTVDSGGYLTIESRLYCSESRDILGRQVPLSSLEKYAGLQPVNRLPIPLYSLGLIPLKTPLENCVDGSADGVSVYGPAAGLIRLININEAQLSGEFERGESRVIVSSDLMDRDDQGRRAFRDHLFTGVDDDPESVGITIFSPALREQSFLARKTEYLRNIESIIGLKRGILSEVEAAERTAKEITSSEGDYNLTIIDFQQMWQQAVWEAVRVCDLLGQMYRLCDSTAVDPQRDIILDWGNGVLYDEDKAWADYMNLVSAGMLKPEIALAWKFSLPWETPEDLAAIREKYMPKMEQLLGGEQ